MKHLFITVAVLLLVIVLSTKNAYASVKIAGTSALLSEQIERAEDYRVKKLTAYLETYNSPLAPHAGTFIAEADKHNLDWKFVAAVSGVESTFGMCIPYNSNNAWGYGVYDGNVRKFTSWDEAIITISKDIRMKYMNTWGAKDIYHIGTIYAADPKWAGKVMYFMHQIEEFDPASVERTLPISI